MEFDLNEFDAVFFDLDGTLLGLSDEDFEGTYTKLIANRFIDKLEPDLFIKALWDGTEAMMAHQDSTVPVLDSFFEKFTEITGMKYEETYERFDSFYRNEFKKLQAVCTPIPEARQLMDALQDKGKTVVLATNPVFPEIATRKRCAWTDLEFDEFRYVSHAENSYACKPYQSYYNRLLEIADVEAERTLMVGNDYLFDMSASVLGMKTWMIDQFQGNLDHKGKFDVHYHGSLSKLLDNILAE